MSTQHHEDVIPNLDLGVRFYHSTVTTAGYVPFHWHSSLELVCVLHGELQFNLSGDRHIIGPQQVMVVSSGVIHDVTNTPNQALVLQVPLAFITPYFPLAAQTTFDLTGAATATTAQLVTDFIRLDQLNTQRPAGFTFDFGAAVLHLLKDLIQVAVSPERPPLHPMGSLKELISYLNGHYADPLTVHGLAAQFGYNADYLSRLFKQQVGLPLIDYLYKLRVTALYHDLLTTDQPIRTLLAANGLTNPRMARRQFQQLYQQLPHQVRQTTKNSRTSHDDG